MDSNHPFPVAIGQCELPEWRSLRRQCLPVQPGVGWTLPLACRAVRMVRFHLSPAERRLRTGLSRKFIFLGREAAVFRGCPGPDERPGSAETRGAREYLAERP